MAINDIKLDQAIKELYDHLHSLLWQLNDLTRRLELLEGRHGEETRE